MANKRSTKIPDWFNLQNYAGVTEFGPLEWGFNLYIRSKLLSPQLHEEFKVKERAAIHKYGGIPAEVLRTSYEEEMAISEEYYGGTNGGLVYGGTKAKGNALEDV